MKRFTSKERLLALVVSVFAWIGVNAETTVIGDYVSIVDGVTVITNPSNQNNFDNWNPKPSDAEIAAIQSATNLKLVGYVGNDAFLLLGNQCHPTTVDLTEAIIDQGTVTYTYYYLDEENQNVRHKPLMHDANGWYYTDNGITVRVAEEDVRIYSASVSGGQKMPDGWKNSLTTLSLPTNQNYNILGADFCNGFTKLSSVTIPNNVTVISDNAFSDTNSLQSITLPSNLKALCYHSFYKSGLTTLSIPGSVEIIEYLALTECTQLTTLIFDGLPEGSTESEADHHMLVKYYGVFNLEKLKDIYINTKALVDCENNAFDFRISWGQGDTTRDMCTLHFNTDAGDHYANLSHPLTPAIAMDAAKFHDWLLEHYTQAGRTTGNGWWEFINNGTIEEKEDEVKGSKFLRTYSDYNYDRIVPQGVKAYIVTGLNQNSDGDFVLNLRQLFVIPKRTGVILYGVSNSKNEAGDDILSMSLCEIANGTPLRRDYWYTLNGEDDMKNYLWPTCVTLDPDESSYVEENYVEYDLDANGNVIPNANGGYSVRVKNRKVLKEAVEPSFVEPWDEQTDYTTPELSMEGYDGTQLNGFYRNFYMSRYGSTVSGKKYKAENNGEMESNFVGFFRAKKSTIKPGMAYLRLKSDEYTNAEGGEVVINPDTKTFTYQNNTYNMKAYQAEYSRQDGKPMLPSQSGYWVEGGNPDMKWDVDANWGDRTKITNKTSGAKYVSVTFSGEPEIIEYEDGTATMIVPMSMIEDAEETDVYYNLQGVKVAHPTKGIYIKNGKKVVIK